MKRQHDLFADTVLAISELARFHPIVSEIVLEDIGLIFLPKDPLPAYMIRHLIECTMRNISRVGSRYANRSICNRTIGTHTVRVLDVGNDCVYILMFLHIHTRDILRGIQWMKKEDSE